MFALKMKTNHASTAWAVIFFLQLLGGPLFPAPRETEKTPQAMLAAAERYLDWQYHAEAQSSYLEIMGQYPEMNGVQEALGYVCLAQQKYDEAIVFFENELAKTPGNGLARLLAGLAHFQAGDKAGARELIAAVARDRSILKKGPFSRKFMNDNPGLIPFVSGLICKELGEWENAQQDLAEAAEQKYGLAEVMVQLVDLYLQRYDPASAQMVLARLGREDSQLAEQLAPIVNGRDNRKARELARSRPLIIRYFKQPIAVIVDDLDKMAKSAVERADPASAFRSWEKALKADDTRFDIHYNLALIYTLYKFLPEGLYHCRRAIDLGDPRLQPWALNLAGNILFEMKDFARAVDFYRQAIDLDSGYLKCRNNLGAAYLKLGDQANAELEWRTVIKNSGKGEKEQDIRELDDEEKIRVLVDVKERSEMIEASQSLAALFIDQKRATEAIPLLERLLQFIPSDAEAHFQLGKIFMYMNDPAPARRHIEAALRNGTANEAEAKTLLAQLKKMSFAPSRPADALSLSAVVLFGVRPLTALDPERYREQGRSCVRAYLDAVSPESRVIIDSGAADLSGALQARKKNMLAQMITILGKDVRQEAELFSNAVPLLLEWEGLSEGPVDEANFADQWLEKRPDTTIAPFLHLFKAHRLRAGYEAARAGHEKGLWPILAERYRKALEKATSSLHPLIACIAADLEAQPFVYLDGQGRP